MAAQPRHVSQPGFHHGSNVQACTAWRLWQLPCLPQLLAVDGVRVHVAARQRLDLASQATKAIHVLLQRRPQLLQLRQLRLQLWRQLQRRQQRVVAAAVIVQAARRQRVVWQGRTL